LAAFFLFSELTLLLATLSGLIFLAWLSRLIALLAGLSGLPALLTFPFHIICHDQSFSRSRARLSARGNLTPAST
jgi:hypothetical protein